MPPEFGRDVDRLCVLELSRDLDADEGEPPDAAGRARRRGQRAAARHRRRDRGRPGRLRAARLPAVRISPLLPIAATQPRGEAIRLDALRGRLAPDCASASRSPTTTRELAEALDRWELSLFADEPFRSAQLRDALAGLLGDTWELRAAVLLGDSSEERRAIHTALRALASGEQASQRAEDAVRRSLVETLRHGDRTALVRSLDDTLLGLRADPRLAETA